jgi:hypothetical protein
MTNSIINKLYKFRFELLFFSLLATLFSNIFLPSIWFENNLMPFFFMLNIASGILLISKNKKIKRIFIFLLAIEIFIFIRKRIFKIEIDYYEFLGFGVYFIFYSMVTYELIKQVWKSKIINKNVIFGLMNGYISLGLICFFIFLTIEIVAPGSFNGIDFAANFAEKKDSLLYFSYITLLTIGYGEITPATVIAQKTALLTGLIGQFYMVILTAIIVGKFIAQTSLKKN